MTKAAALKTFREFDDSPRGDVTLRREAWRNWTDSLLEDGRITRRQHQTWTKPF